MKKIYLSLAAAMFSCAFAQAQGTLSGDLQANVNFFQRDSSINTAPIPAYNNLLSGGESWLSLRYTTDGLSAFLRLDAFHNSNLYDPGGSLTAYGIGAFSITKDIGSLSVTGGYIYDQIGSGILFRAYEDRGQLIDNALVGLQVRYRPSDNITVKAFTGQIKQITPDVLFNRYKPIVKGFSAEGDFGQKVHFSPGIGFINRTLDADSRSNVVSLATSEAAGRGDSGSMFIPYNAYAATLYNTLTAGDFSLYTEASGKTKEAFIGLDGQIHSADGSVLYSTLSYARKGISVNLTGKRTENFVLRTSPNEVVVSRGILNWQPIVARLRPQRLMARYTPASQNVSELAFGADVMISPNDDLDITLNYAHINTLDEVKLYRELYGEIEYRKIKNWKLHAGIQLMEYNRRIYQTKPDAPLFRAVTPFAEITHRFNEKHSIRIDAQYMFAKEDIGSWAYLLVEYDISPRWAFAVSDMYLTKPNLSSSGTFKDNKHFYQFFTAYTAGAHRFTLSYVKQVEGFNCTGGVCRYEPAFSGVRFGITTTF